MSHFGWNCIEVADVQDSIATGLRALSLFQSSSSWQSGAVLLVLAPHVSN